MTSYEIVVSRLRAAGCVFAEDEATLLTEAAGGPADLESMVRQRIDGQPLEYIVGWAEFCGLRIAVDEGVFVPRRRTEFLAQRAVACATGMLESRPELMVLDLCCGSGAVAAVLAESLPGIRVVAADLDPAAVRTAKRNLEPRAATVFEGDLFDALPDLFRGSFDLIAANAPYVPTEEIRLMPPEARLYEASVALDGGSDGLDIQRRLIAAAPDWLRAGGRILVETSERQAPFSLAILGEHGFDASTERSDERDATLAVGSWMSRSPSF